MANAPRPHILGQFQDIGERIVSEVKQIPKDMGQAALESVGMSTGSGKQGTKQTGTPPPGATQESGSAWQKIDQTQSQQEKKVLARPGLEELLRKMEPEEKSIWQQQQDEEAQKKEAEKKQQMAQSNSLPMPRGKTKQGAMGRVNKSKQQGNEMKINMKQD